MTPPRIRIEDRAPTPGRRHALIAALAARLDRPAAALLPATNAHDDVHARQHVTPDGRREENGISWLERVGLEWARGTSDAAQLTPQGAVGETILRSRWQGDAAAVLDPENRLVATLRLDPCRRPQLEPGPAWPTWLRRPSAPERPAARQTCRMALLGDPDRLRDVYCAVLASLGDAADANGVDLDVTPLQDPEGATAPAFDGLLLPGGADMSQVEPLAAAARRAQRQDLPTLGLCLGMQSMALDLVRGQPGCGDVAMAEIDPDAESKLFAPILDAGGAPAPRLGDRAVEIREGRLAETLRSLGLGTRWPERMNHCFRFDRRYEPALREAGAEIAALSSPDAVVDVIAARRLTFFVGAEGHPELTSRPGAPHPLIHAFVHAAAQRARGRQPAAGPRPD